MKSPLTVLTGFVSAAVATTLLAAPTTAHATPQAPTAEASATVKTGVDRTVASKKALAKKKKALAKKKRVAVRKAKLRAMPRKALRVARTKAGKPYRYGSTGPHSFDCSGLTSWAYKKAGKTLPRTSRAQAAVAKRTKSPRKGDLVFFHNGGRVYHVGLYAGKGKVFHASRTGRPVKTERIWTRSVFYGRVAT